MTVRPWLLETLTKETTENKNKSIHCMMDDGWKYREYRMRNLKKNLWDIPMRHFYTFYETFRASKTRKHANTCLRKTFKNLHKILTFELETCKKRHFFFLTIWQSFSNFISFFLAISANNSAKNFMRVNSDRAKKLLLEGLETFLQDIFIQKLWWPVLFCFMLYCRSS